MLCECKYKLNGKKRNSKQNWNSYKCQYDCNSPKKHHVLENDKYIGSIIGDSGITCDEIVQATKIIQIKIFRQMLKNKM